MRVSVCVETQQGASYEQILALASAAARNGFEGIYCSDHYLRMPAKVGPPGGLPGPTDAWTTLAGLARDTSSIRLGTLLTSATFRPPVPLAIIVAQVDAMSGGRVTFGLGAGWVQLEHQVQGIPFPPVKERFDRLEEQLTIITGLWQTPAGQAFSFSGRHYCVTDSPGLPKPAQLPMPPIVIGGSGLHRTPRLAARFASEYNAPFVSVSQARRFFDRVRHACDEAERDPGSIVLSAGLIVCCGRDRPEVMRRAAASGVRWDDRDHGVAGGAPAELTDLLGEWRNAGAGHVYLEVDDISDLEHLDLIGQEVLAQLD
jgi:F420-dependent oxidoreductase-like protein